MDNFPHPPTMILVAAALLVLVFILNRWLFGPLNRILSRRADEIASAQAAFDNASRTQEKRLAAVEAQLAEARKEAFSIREAEQAAARQKRDGLLADARAEAMQRVEQARDELRREVDTARQELEARAEELAGNIAQRLLGRDLRAKR